ncbi:MAG: helix-turn-helix domain-containing protein [Christensenellales bacterium]|jgi:transcriptional regulator with XRE-family HTH domain
MEEELFNIAARIRDIREINEMSIETAAEKVGVSPSLYADYEAARQDIPIGFLYQLAKLFDTDLTILLTGEEPRSDAYFVVRRGKGIAVDRRKDYGYEALAYGFKNKLMEPFMVTVTPKPQDANQYNHEGQEYILVQEGTLRVDFPRNRVTLRLGDSIYFDASTPHGMNAIGGATRFLSIITKSEE